MKKRILAVLLMLCMVITIMPVQALAAGDGEPLQQCVCTERCDAAAPNLECPVCTVDPTQCAVEEAPQQCVCTERCDAAEPTWSAPCARRIPPSAQWRRHLSSATAQSAVTRRSQPGVPCV